MTALRSCLLRIVAAAILAAVAPAALAFGFGDVGARASRLAAHAYKAPAIDMPAELRNLDYDAYRVIRFRP